MEKKEKNISVAMASFHGEKFLMAQLNSLTRQTMLPSELIISDDGSSDGTKDIVKDFATKAPFPVIFLKNKFKIPRGAAQNFSFAASVCTGDYIAFADQDDIWVPQKLEKEFNKMQQLEERYGGDIPLLVHSDLAVVDKRLSMLAPSFLSFQKLHDEGENWNAAQVLCVQNYVTGCTTMVNRALLDIALPLPEEAVMHDWWLALLAAEHGHIGFISDALVLYRQHERNTIGAKKFFSWGAVRSRLALQHGWEMLPCIARQDMAAGQRGCKIAAAYADAFFSGDISRVRCLGVHRQGWGRNQFFFARLYAWSMMRRKGDFEKFS